MEDTMYTAMIIIVIRLKQWFSTFFNTKLSGTIIVKAYISCLSINKAHCLGIDKAHHISGMGLKISRLS